MANAAYSLERLVDEWKGVSFNSNFTLDEHPLKW